MRKFTSFKCGARSFIVVFDKKILAGKITGKFLSCLGHAQFEILRALKLFTYMYCVLSGKKLLQNVFFMK